MTDKIDFSEFTDDVDDTNLLTSISVAADQLKAALDEVTRVQGELAAAEHTAKTLAERILPELMERAKMNSFETSTGLSVSIEEKVRASVIKEAKGKAMDWLRAKGFGKLIKTDVKAEFSAGKEEEALKIYEELRKHNSPSSVTVASGVHHSTFDAWAKKQLEAGTELPTDLFSVFRQRAARIE